MELNAKGALFYAGLGVRALGAMAGAGLLAPVRPDRLLRMAAALRRGFSPATACALAAARHPERAAVIDERGALSFAELERRSLALAAALHARFGVGPERALALMCRNHRGFVEALLAAAHLGADLLLLNTEFPGPQLAEALARRPLGALIADADLAATLDAAGYTGPRVLAWADRVIK